MSGLVGKGGLTFAGNRGRVRLAEATAGGVGVGCIGSWGLVIWPQLTAWFCWL